MKLIGVREFRDRVSHYLACGEVLGVQNHGRLVGVFIPLRAPDNDKVEQAAERLAAVMRQAVKETGMSEDEIAGLFDLSKGSV
ncbi:hypothetical protein [Gloeobacter violaceus]|nr:hypothetical protein [Gloeobacter violaceus]